MSAFLLKKRRPTAVLNPNKCGEKRGCWGVQVWNFPKKLWEIWVMDWTFLPPYFRIFLSLLSCFSSMVFSLDLNEDHAVQCGFSGVAPRNGFGHWIDLCPNLCGFSTGPHIGIGFTCDHRQPIPQTTFPITSARCACTLFNIIIWKKKSL